MKTSYIMMRAILEVWQEIPGLTRREVATAAGATVEEVEEILSLVDLDWSHHIQGNSPVAKPPQDFWDAWHYDKVGVRQTLKAVGMYVAKKNGVWLVCHE